MPFLTIYLIFLMGLLPMENGFLASLPRFVRFTSIIHPSIFLVLRLFLLVLKMELKLRDDFPHISFFVKAHLRRTFQVENYFVAAGMKTLGIAAVGGVGKVLADWIVTGDPQMDVWELDIRRFLPLHNNRNFIKDRVTEIPGKYSRINYPGAEYKTGRRLRMSPIYPRLKAAGAVFGQIMGYERPNYFLLDGQGIKSSL